MTQNATGGRNASRVRRMAVTALGGTLVTVGLRRRSLGGTALALTGGWLLYRGVGGRTRPSESGGATPGSEDSGVEAETDSGATAVERSATVRESPDELYRFWRDSDLLTRIVGGFAEVTLAGEDRHRWVVSAPFGRSIEWETEMVEDRPGEFLRWESTEGAPIPNEGSVRFRPAPADRGTEVTLTLRFDPPGGRAGRSAMNLLGVVPETLASKMLYRFKSLAETGEIPTLDRNPSGRGSGDWV
ncbi:SRPBCC family protein [Halorussus sp. MSC15.2]|uniref:SRPBCC family protein n=1 Tax=Halorussus sp. MSC15.2 TaxID=2283638 RepID=UPI0013CFF512|nr:SRPBCC family protein [Halorussus sp. MSC15.2]NEU56381.1 SRPBCC family protein [Halorussus sp. MSC15.2]